MLIKPNCDTDPIHTERMLNQEIFYKINMKSYILFQNKMSRKRELTKE